MQSADRETVMHTPVPAQNGLSGRFRYAQTGKVHLEWQQVTN